MGALFPRRCYTAMVFNYPCYMSAKYGWSTSNLRHELDIPHESKLTLIRTWRISYVSSRSCKRGKCLVFFDGSCSGADVGFKRSVGKMARWRARRGTDYVCHMALLYPTYRHTRCTYIHTAGARLANIMHSWIRLHWVHQSEFLKSWYWCWSCAWSLLRPFGNRTVRIRIA